MRQNLLDATHDLSSHYYLVLDSHYTVLENNVSWDRFISNHNKSPILLLDLIHRDDRSSVESCLQTNKNDFLLEFRLIDESEIYHWCRLRSESIIRRNGEIVLVLENIDKKKKLQSRISQIESVTGVGTWEIDLNTNDLFWSNMTYKIHEVDESYKPRLEDGISFYHVDSQPVLRQAIEKALKTGQGYDLKLKFITAKGRLRWVRGICKTEMVSGVLVRCHGSFQDITSEYEKEVELQQANERFEAIVNNIPVMLSFFNESGEFEWINNEWVKELGWDLKDAQTRDMMVEFYPDDNYRKTVFDFMIKAEPGWKDFYTRKKDGSFIHTSWANIKLSNGKSIGIGQNINSRKKLEQELTAINKNLELAMDAGGLGTWEYSLKTGQVYFSDRWCRMMGFDPQEIRHEVQTWENCVHPDDKVLAWQKMSACLNGDIEFFESTQRLKKASGEWAWIYTRGQVIERDSEKAPVRFLALSLDITSQKQNEENLSKVNQQLQFFNERMELALKVVKFGVWDWNMRTNVLSWDDYMFELFKLSRSEFHNSFDSFNSRLLPEDSQRIGQELQNCFSRRETEFRSEFKIKTPDTDKLKIIEVAATCFYDSSGAPERLVGSNWDITEQRQLELSLKVAKDELEKFFSILVDPMCVADFSGKLKRINPAFSTVLGYSEKELFKLDWIELVHPDDVEKTRIHFAKLAKGNQTAQFENRFRSKTGEYRIFSWSAISDIESGFVYAAIRDLTEQKKTELQMLESSKLATLGEMAAGIAHEINNPLAIIKARADQLLHLLERGQLSNEKIQGNVSIISNTVQRIAKIVSGLRSFSRDSSQEPMAETDISKVIDDSISMCYERFKNHGVRFMNSTPVSLVVNCRAIQVSQVILNLLNNSFDAVMNESEKWIQVDVVELDHFVRITVTDSGKGIPEAVVKKMMMPFFTTKEVGKGTGLGLSISKGIIEDHQGRFYYDAECANTRFVIELPK